MSLLESRAIIHSLARDRLEKAAIDGGNDEEDDEELLLGINCCAVCATPEGSASASASATTPTATSARRCPSGHVLVDYAAHCNGGCDTCDADVPKDAHVSACTACDYWVCGACREDDAPVPRTPSPNNTTHVDGSCKACGRIYYCSSRCASADVNAHGAVCATLREIGAREKEEEAAGADAHRTAVASAIAACVSNSASDACTWDELLTRSRSRGALPLDGSAAHAGMSELLSFPMTLSWAMRQLPGMGSVRRRLLRGVHTTILIAGAGIPETTVLDSWCLVAAACIEIRRDVSVSGAADTSRTSSSIAAGRSAGGARASLAGRSLPLLTLVLVGPEIPVKLHGTRQRRGAANTLELVFWRGLHKDYLSAAQQKAPASPGTPSTPAATTSATAAEAEAKTKMACAAAAAAAAPAAAALDANQCVEYSAVALFNPGLSCPDYSWPDEIRGFATQGLPILLATNTRTELLFEAEVLEQACTKGYITAAASTSPARIRARMGGATPAELRRPGAIKAQMRGNPFASERWLQSGSMANDLYRKNAWIACVAPPPPEMRTAATVVSEARGREESGKGRDRMRIIVAAVARGRR